MIPNTNNYTDNYNPIQLRLPLDVSTIIPSDDQLYSFIELKRKVCLEKFVCRSYHKGNKGYDPIMMLEVVLFAYSIQVYSLRKIEQACKTDIRFMYLANNQTPSAQAFCRFINKYLLNSIDDIFYEFSKVIIDLDGVDTSKLYIDGTKLEANATKNSFVWKKSVLGYTEKLMLKISKIIPKINELVEIQYNIQDNYTLNDLLIIENNLIKIIKEDKVELVYGKGMKKSPIQRCYDLILEYKEKLIDYTLKLEICGDRNSYSKVDNDATFMNMKYDYYNNTGVFKPGYNVQIGVSSEYILHVETYQRPADTKLFIPFMDSYKSNYDNLPKYPIGDAGYGSYDNYMYCLDNNMELSLKYSYFNKVNYDKKFKKNIYHSLNFKKLDDGTRICPMGHRFDIFLYSKINEKSSYQKKDYIYECSECYDCSVKEECTKAKGNRKVSITPKIDEMYNQVDNLLTSDLGVKLRKERSIQVEGAFGVIKEDFKYVRIHRRSIEKVKTEVKLVCLGFNIKKYHNKKQRKKLS